MVRGHTVWEWSVLHHMKWYNSFQFEDSYMLNKCCLLEHQFSTLGKIIIIAPIQVPLYCFLILCVIMWDMQSLLDLASYASPHYIPPESRGLILGTAVASIAPHLPNSTHTCRPEAEKWWGVQKRRTEIEEQQRDRMRQATQAAKGTGWRWKGAYCIVTLNPAVGLETQTHTHTHTPPCSSYNHKTQSEQCRTLQWGVK